MRRYFKDPITGEYAWREIEGGVTRYSHGHAKGEVDPDAKKIHIIRDLDPFISPITDEVISSRSHRRTHMRDHGVEEVGNERPKPRKVPDLPSAAPDIAQVMREKGYIG